VPEGMIPLLPLQVQHGAEGAFRGCCVRTQVPSEALIRQGTCAWGSAVDGVMGHLACCFWDHGPKGWAALVTNGRGFLGKRCVGAPGWRCYLRGMNPINGVVRVHEGLGSGVGATLPPRHEGERACDRVVPLPFLVLKGLYVWGM
jgi:hypothetical protein